jgi:hypothetical protein
LEKHNQWLIDDIWTDGSTLWSTKNDKLVSILSPQNLPVIPQSVPMNVDPVLMSNQYDARTGFKVSPNYYRCLQIITHPGSCLLM